MNIRLAVALAATLSVSACANAVKPEELPQLRIADVQVTVNPGVKAVSDIGTKVRMSSLAAAQAYNAYMPANAPSKVVQINVDRVHYKNPLASLLIGDGNGISGVVAGGATPATSVGYLDRGSMAINGIAGAVIAAASDKSNVDTRLATGLANNAMAKAYGQKSVPDFISKHLAGRPTSYQPRTYANRPVTPRATQETPRQYDTVAEQTSVTDGAAPVQPTYSGPTAPEPAT